MTPAQLKSSAEADAQPPRGLSREAQSLWFIKKGEWDKAHDIAQDIDITLAYAADNGEWLTLDSRLEGGRTLRYRRVD